MADSNRKGEAQDKTVISCNMNSFNFIKCNGDIFRST